jgi:hypothetical protein
MPSASFRIKRGVAYAVIGAVWATCLVAVAMFVVIFAIYADLRSPATSHWTKGTGLENIARELYLGYFRPGWQDGNGYVDFDPELIYVPRPGKFSFRSPEFDVTLTFSPEGLRPAAPPTPSAGPLVAVAGDSFAMGWGVADDQAFPTLLQSQGRFAVANAAVSSYGTARELLRLRRLGWLSRAEVVIIAYSANDAEENRQFVAQAGDLLRGRDAHELWSTLGHYHQQSVSFPLVTSLVWKQIRDRQQAQGLAALWPWLVHDTFPATNERVAADLPVNAVVDNFQGVLERFPELHRQRVMVVELNDWGRQTGFSAELAARHPPGLTVVSPEFVRSDFFRFDNHLTPAGHQKVAAALAAALAGSH